MSASQWRRAMNSAATAAAPTTAARAALSPRPVAASGAGEVATPSWLARFGARIRATSRASHDDGIASLPAPGDVDERGASAARGASVGAAAVAAEFIARRHCDALIRPAP